jgi:hypothetical protein
MEMTIAGSNDGQLLIEHFEARLGRLASGWSVDSNGEKIPFQVARFEAGRFADTLSFATIGLSSTPLLSTSTGRLLRHEVFCTVKASFGEHNLPGLLQQVGMLAIEKEEAILRGEVIQLSGRLFDDSSMVAFYAALPVYFDDSFAVCRLDSGRQVAIIWLVPVHQAEAHQAHAKGWQSFEDLLVATDPDLFDPYRASVVPAEL